MSLPPEFPTNIIDQSPLRSYLQPLKRAFQQGWDKVMRHGDFPRWQEALARMPVLNPTAIHLDQPAISIDAALTNTENQHLRESLKNLMPWRKGPYHIGNINIDCEWRSDLKWERFAHAMTPLQGRTVLDVGCGSGYHCWRMRGAGAKLIIGIDPTALFSMQFQAIQHGIGDAQVQLWPLGIDDMSGTTHCFNTIFSMGVLYHRQSPLDHLKQLHSLLQADGELILETLVIDGDSQACLMPKYRYAKMRNVWFITSIALLTTWLTRCGWHNIQLIDCTTTTCQEQRTTEWMPFESLIDFLDPNNISQTVEGYPAPQRATLIAHK